MHFDAQDSPRERENLLCKLPEQSILGGVGEHQDNVNVTWSQSDQVTGVGDVCKLRHLHKVLLWRTAAQTTGNNRGEHC